MLKAIGAPFKIEYSSSGSNPPKNFKWSKDSGIAEVYIDNGLLRGANEVKTKNKFGWFCESKIVKQNIFNDIKNNLIKYKNSYNKIFTCDETLIELDTNLFEFCYSGSNLPWTPYQDQKIYNKTKLVSLLASPNQSTEGHVQRIQLAEKFKNSVDLYGGIFGSKKIGISGTEHYHHKSKAEALNDYMFSITIENYKYNTYFTEKVTDCFASGTIPVYYGTEKISNHFDSNGIIILNDSFDISTLTPDLYYSKITSVKNNLETIKSFIGADDLIYNKIKELI
jgi:hypothetical protein